MKQSSSERIRWPPTKPLPPVTKACITRKNSTPPVEPVREGAAGPRAPPMPRNPSASRSFDTASPAEIPSKTNPSRARIRSSSRGNRCGCSRRARIGSTSRRERAPRRARKARGCLVFRGRRAPGLRIHPPRRGCRTDRGSARSVHRTAWRKRGLL